MPHWRAIDIPHDSLNLDYTLTSGQAFRWKKAEDGSWVGVIGHSVVRLRLARDHLQWRARPDEDMTDALRDYFRLSEDVGRIYAHLASADAHVGALVRRFRGLRLLRQPTQETLLTFVCSAANSIPRISAAIRKLSASCGDFIASVGGEDYHTFPNLEALAAADGCLLDNAGLGFRGAALQSIARQILERPHGWLDSLRTRSYQEAKAELVALRGVGPKIADCVCLFALGKDEAVPVDTHVRQLAARLYLPDLTTRSVTESVYRRVSECFGQRFGQYAGWSQQLLYYEDLLLGGKRNRF